VVKLMLRLSRKVADRNSGWVGLHLGD
jgi:hypothetical protein